MVRKKTVAAFEKEFVGNEEEIQQVLDLTAEGMVLAHVAVKVKRPYTLLYPFFNDGGEMQKRYEGALRAWGDRLQAERLEIADGVKDCESGPKVMAAKLRSDVRDSMGKALNRERWGERVEHKHSGVAPSLVIEINSPVQIGQARDERLVAEIPPAQLEKAQESTR